jgi:hypothetical protein
MTARVPEGNRESSAVDPREKAHSRRLDQGPETDEKTPGTAHAPDSSGRSDLGQQPTQNTPGSAESRASDNRRVIGSDAARAVGRFKPDGPDGYRARSLPDGPIRATRAEAENDERRALDGRCPLRCGYAYPVPACVRLHLIQHHDYSYAEAQEAYLDE